MIRWLERAGAGGVLAILLVGAAQADPITITDLTGRTIKLDGPAERIVTLLVPLAATVIALDQSRDRLSAFTPNRRSPSIPKYWVNSSPRQGTSTAASWRAARRVATG